MPLITWHPRQGTKKLQSKAGIDVHSITGREQQIVGMGGASLALTE